MDNIIVTILSVTLVILSIGFLWIYKSSKKKLVTRCDELKFFKQEKEYYDEALLVLSEDYDIVFANQAAKMLFSLDKNYIRLNTGKTIELKVDTSYPDEFFKVLKEKSQVESDSFHLENVLLVISGKMKQVNIYVDKSAWNLNKTITCIIDMRMITPIKAKNVTSANDGGIDFFTGLPSQFSALTDINSLVIESKKKSESFALFLLGIDHFTELQTTLGLGYSNQIIKRLADYFKKYKEENIRVFRMDCDKFLLIVEKLEGEEDIRKIARKILTEIGNFYKEDSAVRLTASMGIAMYPTLGENATKLINHVYIALDQAQKESESNIVFFTTEYQSIHKDEVKMNEEIRKGLNNNEFFLYYQPMFSLEHEEMVGAEALIRWNHPEHGLITADKFLDVAKRTGLIVDIGEYVFREAIKQRREWDTKGLKKFKITVNLSLKEMKVNAFIKKLASLFEQYSVDPKDFNLDITEAAAMSNIEQSLMDFKLFKELGLSLSLDQFGASYSSLKYLQALPLSMIKIDRSLIFDLYFNLDHQIAVKSMIALIHGLGFEVAAEGVETSKESKLLYDLGCNYAQGYLFSRPLPALEFQELLK
ncbi:MAG: bifunctional diguanylate cyclase/phosphodiesterase [Sulfurovum sp.]|nr:bifunctional diguanylate cyclase/phosphodiesterase [Sulfurovum sp.]